jgi:hypothetical protein
MNTRNGGNAQQPKGQQQQKPRGPKPPHRKGQQGNRDQAPARGDVMKVNTGAVSGPVTSASDLMRRLATQN